MTPCHAAHLSPAGRVRTSFERHANANALASADAVRTIVREEGPLALYKGVVPALVLCGQGAVQFTVYEWLKARVPKQSENVSLKTNNNTGTVHAAPSCHGVFSNDPSLPFNSWLPRFSGCDRRDVFWEVF